MKENSYLALSFFIRHAKYRIPFVYTINGLFGTTSRNELMNCIDFIKEAIC